ncbi:MAG: hypothetical protein SOR95_08210 [Sutterella sp.]|nr:hypothetical protein [Sutterella sp.]
MKKRFHLTSQTADCIFRIHKYEYWVDVPKSSSHVCFALVIERDEKGRWFYPRLEVGYWVIAELASKELRHYSTTNEILTILENATNGFGDWEGSDSYHMKLYLGDSEFFGLLPKNHIHELENEELGDGWPPIKIDWEAIDWFDKGKEGTGQLCLPYVEQLLNMAVDYCVNEWKKTHEE